MKPISILGLAPLLLLAACSGTASDPRITLQENDGRMSFVAGDGRELLGYQFAVYPAPEGEDPAYARSGFIHPVNSPSGQRLTQIQPPDHYHHYGIWNPWTHVSFRGRDVDFWNIRGKQGTVRFAGFKEKDASGDHGEIKAVHEHVVFNEDGTETVALNELQTIRVTATDNPNQYLVDLTFDYNCATDDPFKIIEHRYAGLGWRATEEWRSENCSVLTSEGIAREGADGSLARWVIAEGVVDGVTSGIALLSHPSNYNHPEPLRVWPDGNHDGQLFVNFAPTKTKDWTLEPGKTYTLRYRMVVFTGEFGAEDAEGAWVAFAE